MHTRTIIWIALFFILILHLANAEEPTLEDKWNLEEPTFDYASRQFLLTYQFSEYLDGFPEKTFGKLYLYDNTESADSELNCKQTNLENENAYMGSALRLVESGISNSGNTTYETRRQETLTISMDPLAISNEQDIFTDGDGEARIDFCVRYGLYTGNYIDSNNFEVNFVETLVTLLVDLTGEFNVTGINVAPKERLKRTANEDYGLEAFQCSGKTAEGGNPIDKNIPFSQGDVITICVQPDEVARGDDVYMRQVTYFQYILLEEDGVTESSTGQLAIDISNAAKGPLGEMHGLTNIDTCIGEVACVVETILFASFFARPGTIAGKGSAIMQFGTEGADGVRKLLRQSSRSLQEEAASRDFDLQFDVGNASFDPFLLRHSEASGRSSSCALVVASLLLLLGSSAILLLV